MKRHIASILYCFCMVMQLSAYPHPGVRLPAFHHSNHDGDMPIVYPGWRDNKPAAAAPERTPNERTTKPAKEPFVQPSILPDLPDETDGETGDRAHIVYNKGTEKDGTSLTIDLEPQETKEIFNSLSPAINGLVIFGGALILGYGIYWYKNKK
jgi:hypothetical protein